MIGRIFHIHCMLSWCQWDQYAHNRTSAQASLMRHWLNAHPNAPFVRMRGAA